MIPVEQKQATHLQIGRLLWQTDPQIEQKLRLFDIVGHLNQARELITQSSERYQLIHLNLKDWNVKQKLSNASKQLVTI
ncbi:MAG: hypothetical protein HC935_08895 [Pseudanabaena sp. SU_2_4]|nr:hypothetical protein [Pseudanabaena sp. SU_2_4]